MEQLEIAWCSLKPLPPSNQPQSTPTWPCCHLIPPDILTRNPRAARCRHQMSDGRRWAYSANTSSKVTSRAPNSINDSSSPRSCSPRQSLKAPEEHPCPGSRPISALLASSLCPDSPDNYFIVLRSWHLEGTALRALNEVVSSMTKKKKSTTLLERP